MFQNVAQTVLKVAKVVKCHEMTRNCDKNQRPERNWKNHIMTKYNKF